jgi:putative flippase GtrA
LSPLENLLQFLKKILDNSFLRFMLTGGLNTVFGYLIFSLFVYLTGKPSLSVILANIVGVLFNFKTYGKFVFKSKDNSRIYRFAGVYLFVTVAQISSLKLLAQIGITNPYAGAAIVTLPIAAASFILMRKFVFRQNLTFTDSIENGSQPERIQE